MTRSITLTNTGSASLFINGIQQSGANALDFGNAGAPCLGGNGQTATQAFGLTISPQPPPLTAGQKGCQHAPGTTTAALTGPASPAQPHAVRGSATSHS